MFVAGWLARTLPCVAQSKRVASFLDPQTIALDSGLTKFRCRSCRLHLSKASTARRSIALRKSADCPSCTVVRSNHVVVTSGSHRLNGETRTVLIPSRRFVAKSSSSMHSIVRPLIQRRAESFSSASSPMPLRLFDKTPRPSVHRFETHHHVPAAESARWQRTPSSDKNLPSEISSCL